MRKKKSRKTSKKELIAKNELPAKGGRHCMYDKRYKREDLLNFNFFLLPISPQNGSEKEGEGEEQ